jgi:peptide/nickel transport system ATP-binding protein
MSSAPVGLPLLDVKGLNIEVSTRGTWRPAVTDVSLSVRDGEMVGLVGESGSGKSLTGMAIMGLLDVGAVRNSGSVVVGGQLFAGPGRYEIVRGRRAGLAAIFQNPMTSLNPSMRVGLQVAEAVRLHQKNLSRRQAWARALELLDLVKLGSAVTRVARQYPHQLSGGMRQRAMIAIALACEPRVLIADEPTTALDATVQRSIMALLQEIRQDLGVGILLISHNLPLVASWCDRLLAMYAGELVESGSARAVLEHPRHPYVSALIRCTPEYALRTGVIRSLKGRVPGPSEWPESACRFAPRCAFAVPQCHANHPAEFGTGAGRWARCLRTSELVELNRPSSLSDPVPEVSLNGTKTASHDPGRPTLLAASGATKRYGSRYRDSAHRVVAVEGVDLSIGVGESVGLVGESGSGKSTLGWLICGLIKPDSGSLNLGDRRINGPAARGPERGTIQMIFQDPYSSLNPSMRIADIVQEPLRRLRGLPKKQASQEAEELLEKVGLDPSVASARPGALSGGQRQRVSIARAIAARPKLIVCDESVSALDVSVQSQILSLLRELQVETGVSYLFISHDIAVVRLMSTRVAVMAHGRIVEECSSAQLAAGDVQESVTRGLLEASPGV